MRSRISGNTESPQTHLVVLHDDDFTHFVRHATEVVARVGLDYGSRKTVKQGALFYQEFLPSGDAVLTPSSWPVMGVDKTTL